MSEWLKCPTLNFAEQGLIDHLKASETVDAFKASAAAFFNSVPIIMFSAINKARAAGIGNDKKH